MRERYPRRRGKGGEYYPKNCEWLVDADGKQLYARNGKGGELYPNRASKVFARDASGEYYYAKDEKGDEYYPIRGNQSLFIVDPVSRKVRLALYADGS